MDWLGQEYWNTAEYYENKKQAEQNKEDAAVLGAVGGAGGIPGVPYKQAAEAAGHMADVINSGRAPALGNEDDGSPEHDDDYGGMTGRPWQPEPGDGRPDYGPGNGWGKVLGGAVAFAAGGWLVWWVGRKA